MTTGYSAHDTRPGRPRLRISRRMSTHRAGTSSSWPWTTGASLPVISGTQAASAYVHPRPVTSPARTCTTTIVVLSHVSVPSASGPSAVGTR
jgi:hypothetical protein